MTLKEPQPVSAEGDGAWDTEAISLKSLSVSVAHLHGAVRALAQQLLADPPQVTMARASFENITVTVSILQATCPRPDTWPLAACVVAEEAERRPHHGTSSKWWDLLDDENVPRKVLIACVDALAKLAPDFDADQLRRDQADRAAEKAAKLLSSWTGRRGR